MRELTGKLLILLPFFFILSACEKLFEKATPKPVMARLPWPTADGSYHFQDIELRQLKDVAHLQSDLVSIYESPVPFQDGLSGSGPYLQYIQDADGVVIPTDAKSLQLLSLYAHLEKLYDLDLQLGTQASWPLNVGFEANFTRGEEKVENNALYIASNNALLFVPFQQPDLPLAVNAGVIGHEHFHSIFYKKVLEGSVEQLLEYQFLEAHTVAFFKRVFGSMSAALEPMSKEETVSTEPGAEEKKLRLEYLRNIIRGFNEGMADLWGWIYTDNADFISASLPQMKTARKLDVLPVLLSTTDDKMLEIATKRDPIERAYNFGTQYSRLFKGFSDLRAKRLGTEKQATRMELAKTLLQSLDGVKAEIVALKADQTLSSYSLLNHFVEAIPEISPEECRYFATYAQKTAEFKSPQPCQETPR